VRHACKLLPPWPIKGGAFPQPQGTKDREQRSPTRSPSSPRYWHSPQSIPLGLGGPASSPTTLVAPLYEHHGAIQCPEHTTAGRTALAGTRINPVSLVASTGPSRGRSQRSLLVSVGTTFRTDTVGGDLARLDDDCTGAVRVVSHRRRHLRKARRQDPEVRLRRDTSGQDDGRR
jgi:hypothetical protein